MEQKAGCQCLGKGNQMGRFLEASLLLLLRKECAHGYGLMERLELLGFNQDELNVSTLYRTLRKMEKSGLVRSSWEEGEGGPQRRMYDITEQGILELEEWFHIFQERKRRIERFLDIYEKNCPVDEQILG